MRLGELIRNINNLSVCGAVDLDAEVRGLTHDYAQVEAGFIYTCLANEEYAEAHLRGGGEAHVGEALRRGALCVLRSGTPIHSGLPLLVSPTPNEHTAILAERLHGHPLASMTTIGVTGTNGKTSVTFMLASVLAACGYHPGVAGTLGFWSPGFRAPNSVYTTPLASELSRNAALMRAQGVDALLLESTSHGLALAREHAVVYGGAIFTNLTRDHMDFHRDVEDYIDAKLSLFRRLRPIAGRRPVAVINVDDPLGERFAAAATGARVLRCSLRGAADYRGRVLTGDAGGTTFEVTIGGDRRSSIELRIGTPGRFNVQNALLAFGLAHGLGLRTEDIRSGLASVRPIPGRFEIVDVSQPSLVVIDYAHTPAALEQTIAAARELTEGRVLTMFGAGGDRDREKRPEMGRVAVAGSDHVILTSDNPRWEDPMTILREIAAGVAPGDRSKLETVVDREEAILRALDLARAEDLVLLCGKGHETQQFVRGRALPFDDRSVVQAYAGARGREGGRAEGAAVTDDVEVHPTMVATL